MFYTICVRIEGRMKRAIVVFIILLGTARYTVSDEIISKAGESVTLPCSQAGFQFPAWRGPGIQGPDVTYSYAQSAEFGWPSLGEKVNRLKWDPADNKSLVIMNLNRNDSGTYICELRLSVQIDFHLNVKVLPKPDFVGAEVQNATRTIIDGQENQALNLSCTVTNAPEKYLLSIFDVGDLVTPLLTNDTVTNSSDGTFTVMQSILILPTREFDGKKYVCRSVFDPPTAATSWSDEAELYLKLKPVSPKLTSTPGIENLTHAIVECSTSGFRPIVSLQIWWYVDGSNTTGDVAKTLDTSTDTYNVTAIYRQPVNRDDHGKKVECFMFHETLSAPMVGSKTLDVHYPAKYATLTGNTTEIVANGVNTLTLTCTASNSNPAPNFTWIIGDQLINSDQQVTWIEREDGSHMTSQLLDIVADRRYDNSDVYCVLNNDFDDVSVESNRELVGLLYHPVVNIEGPTEIIEGDTGAWVLKCIADSNPAPTFTWYHDNVQLFENVHTIDKVSEYTINSSERRNAGKYTCIANNGIGPEGRGVTNFVVLHKAEITNFSIIEQDGHTKLLCRVISTPPAQMTIVKDNRALHVGNGVIELEFNLQHLDCLDSGTYTCTAFNEYNAGTFVTQSLNVTAACNAHPLEEISASLDETLTLSSTLMVHPIPSVGEVKWMKYEKENWKPIAGGYIVPKTDNVAVFARNVTLIGGSDFGYYRVEIADGQTSNFAQMFHVLQKDGGEPKTFRATMMSETSNNSPVLYIVLTVVGAIVGAFITILGCYFRNRSNGKVQTNSFYSPRSKRDSGKDLIYEDIDEHRMRIPANFYSDLNDSKTPRDLGHGCNQTTVQLPPLRVKAKQIKADADQYIDMTASKRISTITSPHDGYLEPSEYSRMEKRKSIESGEMLNGLNSNYMSMQGNLNKDKTDTDYNKQGTYANEGKI